MHSVERAQNLGDETMIERASLNDKGKPENGERETG